MPILRQLLPPRSRHVRRPAHRRLPLQPGRRRATPARPAPAPPTSSASPATPTNGYSLDLFTDTTGGGPTGYGYDNYVLSAQSPDGASPSDWNNFTLATAQPGSNPSATVLFALNTTTGALYESVNPSPGTQCSSYTPIPATCTLIGTPQSTWTQITAPWGTSPPALLSADINTAGQPELWARSGTTITAYTLTGATLSRRAHRLAEPAAARLAPRRRRRHHHHGHTHRAERHLHRRRHLDHR